LPFSQDSSYSVEWDYDRATNTYLRINGGAKHIDKDTGKQFSAKNVVVLLMTARPANDGYDNNLHVLYTDKGNGKALIFMGGKETIGTWSKTERAGRTILKDSTGAQVQLDPGLIWFEVFPAANSVTVK